MNLFTVHLLLHSYLYNDWTHFQPIIHYLSLSLSHTHYGGVIGVEEQYNVFIQLNLELWYSIKYTIY